MRRRAGRRARPRPTARSCSAPRSAGSATSSVSSLNEHAPDPQTEVGLVEREVDHHVERLGAALGRDRRAACGRQARDARGSRRSRTCPSAGRRSPGCRPRSSGPARATPGSAYAARRSSTDCAISAANSGFDVERERLGERVRELQRPRRHLRPHLGALRPARAVEVDLHAVRPRGRRQQRAVGERHAGPGCSSYMSAMPHCSPGAIATTTPADLARSRRAAPRTRRGPRSGSGSACRRRRGA